MKRTLKYICCFFWGIAFTFCYKTYKRNELKTKIQYINSVLDFKRNYNDKRNNTFLSFPKIEQDKKKTYRKIWKTWKRKNNNIYLKHNTDNTFEFPNSSLDSIRITQNELKKIKSNYIHTIINRENELKKKEMEKEKWLHYSQEEEQKLKEQIEKRKKEEEEMYNKNNTFLNTNFKYTSNFLPINVEKKYIYENFKYSEELVLYIFFIINMFKHEQFKNKIYKTTLRKHQIHGGLKIEKEKEEEKEKEGEEEKEETEEDIWDNTNNQIEQNNRKLINDVINKFGDQFTFFNPSEKIQREDWAHIFKLEKEDKTHFFKNIKIKNEKKKEYFLLIYYCNWQYACMALYNALHNIFHNTYNYLHFYNLWEKEQKEQINTKLPSSETDKLQKSDIEKIKEMYIEDIKNQEPMDIDSLLMKDQQFFDNTEGDTDNEQAKNQKKVTEEEEYENINKRGGVHDVNFNGKGDTLQDQGQKEKIEKENKKKTWQEIMEEKKKKLDEEYFLHGYSQYENEEEIKKEEEEIKETKRLIEEEKESKTKLNKEQDFKNIYKNFYLKLNNYNNTYNYVKPKSKEGNRIDQMSNITEPVQKEKEKKHNSTGGKADAESHEGESKKEVNINVIFVRISNSTVIGKTKNIKEKIKKKWIYSHQKEIKFYEIILSAMLNENIYYKDIPYVELYSLNYETQKLYDFFNSVNTNLKHSFIHKNKVYDVFNNVINDQMDVYNFGVFDRSKFEPPKNKNGKEEIELGGDKQKEGIFNKEGVNHSSTEQDEDIIIEEMDPSIETDEEKKYQVVFDQHSGILNDKNINKQEIDKKPEETKEQKESKERKTINDESSSFQYIITNKKPNKKERSKYEALFRQKYTNIFINNLRDKLQVEHISSIPNFDHHANFTIDTFKDLSLNNFFKKYNWEKIAENKKFDVDNNYIYYNNQKIPKDLFPFLLQLSMAFKFEHTSLLIQAPKKIKFQFRNV